MVYVRPNLNEVVAGMPAVQARVKAQAVGVETRMKAVLAKHIRTGNLFRSVKVERAFKEKDYWIHVSAKYVIPANYGSINSWSHKRIEGIHFIKKAVYGA
jgi:hypothetical protein